MKKKLLVGLSSIGLAAGFWACGSGTVEPMNEETDGYVKAMLETQSIDFANQVADAKKECLANPACENEMAKANGAAIQIESSETPMGESSSSGTPTPGTSSSVNRFSFGGSSLGPVGQQSSSSEAPVSVAVESSSAITVPKGQYGSCAANKATVELNEEVTWTFTFNTAGAGLQPTDVVNASFAWAFPGGTPESATGSKTAKTKYGVSGGKTATVAVTAAGATQNINCDVNVNGAPITNCKCVSTNTQPDVSQGESATWTASGCTTTANITGYTWKGATADASGLVATAPVTAKGDIVSGVSFTVANDDNTKVTVACEDAKAIDITSPDYLLEVTGGQISQDKIEVLNEGCITVKGTWDNQYYTPTITVVCDASGSNVSLKITYGSATPVTGTGAYGVNNITMPLGKAQAGAIEYNNVCITLSGAESAKCGLGTQG